jgi:hypothetical protein
MIMPMELALKPNGKMAHPKGFVTPLTGKALNPVGSITLSHSFIRNPIGEMIFRKGLGILSNVKSFYLYGWSPNFLVLS